MKIEFDPESKLSYGKIRCADCGLVFHMGGARGCKCTGELIYMYSAGQKEKMDRGIAPGLGPFGLLDAYIESQIASHHR